MQWGTLEATQYIAVFAACVAVYAALVSTFSLAWNILSARPVVKVDLVFGAAKSATGSGYEVGIYLSIANPSAHTVHIQSATLQVPRHVTWKERLRAMRRRRAWYWFNHNMGWIHCPLSDQDGVKTGLPMALGARASHGVFMPGPVVERLLSGAPRRIVRAYVRDALGKTRYTRVVHVSSLRKLAKSAS